MPSPSRSALRERLAWYLLGVAISCVLLGFLWAGRYQAARRERQNQPVAAPAATGAVAPTAAAGSSVK